MALLAADNSAAQGVTFSITPLPRNVRQDGLTEVAGDLSILAFSNGTVPAGSSIDVTFSSAITNNTSLSNGNISLANNVACTSDACPSSATLVGSQIVRLFFSANTIFGAANRIDVSRVRLNANAVAGAGIVTATVTAVSADPVNHPIDFFSTQTRTVANVVPAVVITPNPGGSAVKSFVTCSIPPGSGFSVRLAGPLTSFAEETSLSPAAAPTNGTTVRLTLTGIPSGLTLDTPTATVGDFLPTDGGSFASTGAPIILNYTVATSSSGSAFATLPFTVSVTGGGTVLPPLGTPAIIEATAQVGPVTSTDTVIVRFVSNSYGPSAVATVGDCRTHQPARLVSE